MPILWLDFPFSPLVFVTFGSILLNYSKNVAGINSLIKAILSDPKKKKERNLGWTQIQIGGVPSLLSFDSSKGQSRCISEKHIVSRKA